MTDVKPEPERDVKQMETVPNTKIVPEFVLGGIVEKNVDVGKPVLKNAGQVGVTGFPQAPKRSLVSSNLIFFLYKILPVLIKAET